MLSLEQCQDLFEKAMIADEEGRAAEFEKHMTKAAAGGAALLKQQTKAKAETCDLEETKEFLGQCYFELGTFYMEQSDNSEDEVSVRNIEQARQYFSRALESDISAAFYKSALLSLSELHAARHEHEQDIELCLDYVRKLTEKYNPLTPLQNDVLDALAQAYGSLNRQAEAEEIYKRIVSICRENFGAECERTKEAEEDLQEFMQNKEALVCSCLSPDRGERRE